MAERRLPAPLRRATRAFAALERRARPDFLKDAYAKENEMRDLGLLIAVAVASVASLAAAGCGDKATPETDLVMSSEKEEEDCPADVTYKKVAKPFFDEYCRGCHSEKVASEDAPEVPHMFDTEADIRAAGQHVYEALEGKTMPPSDAEEDLPMPTSKERKAVLEWLQCSGATEESHAGH